MKKKRLSLSLLILLCLALNGDVAAQDADTIYQKVFMLPNKLFGSIDQKAEKLEVKFNRQAENYLKRLAKQEQQFKRKLYKKDSAAANKIFANSQAAYDKLEASIQNPAPPLNQFRNVYDGHLDSLRTALQFVDMNSLSPGMQQQFSKSLGQLNMLQGKLNQADNIKKVLQQRQQYLKQQLQNFGMVKEYKKFQQQVYYYQQQVQDYKDMLDDPSKLEKKALQMAGQLPAFKTFFAQHSELAFLFKLPSSNPLSAADLGNLQTRGAIEAAARDQLGNSLNMNATITDSRESVDANITALKTNLRSLKSGQVGSDNINQPDFKPNVQKTKSFKDRLEFGTNFQSVKSNYFFPATSDIGVSLGYKLNDKSVVGLGLSGKLGLGTGWNHLALSYEGVGVRQFVDILLKGSFWISGGAEMNYRTKFNSVEALKNYSSWQQSALIGLSKKLKVGKAKSQVQLLYDFLWKQQVPVTQPVLFRVGYNL